MARFSRNHEQAELNVDRTKLVETSVMTAARTLHDARAARIAYYLRVAELLDTGWRRTSRFADDLLESEELPFPVDDDAAREVYRDWLLERGDPRGELATLRAADPLDTRAIASLEKTRGVELFGLFSMLPRTWRDDVSLVWRRGWVDEIVVQHGSVVGPLEELVHAALHAPMARFARYLTLDVRPKFTCACLDRITVRSRD
jgi:hypothetical protein